MKRQISFSILAAALAVLVLSFFPKMEMKAAGTATLNSAVIQGDQVVVTGTSSIVSEDGILHLYAQDPYESGVQGVEVAQAPNDSILWCARPQGRFMRYAGQPVCAAV